MKTTSLALLLSVFSVLSFAEAQPTIDSQQARTSSAAQDWRTPAEISDYRTTPRYDETFAYVRRLAQAAPRQMKLEVFGKTGEGRDLIAVIVSKDGDFDPARLHAQGRPIVLIQNAIHAGEMDGKDASLALMRDILIGVHAGSTPGQRPGATQSNTQSDTQSTTPSMASLVDRAVLVIIPIYNADGHERFGPYNRINQNGPEEMGWRTTARNLNLNRDYMKADAPETRAFLKLWNRWLPDFFVDDHVTDGADYQFDMTYYISSGPDVYPATAAWVRDELLPSVNKSVEAAGHLISPYMDLADPNDPAKGMTANQEWPRFAGGYALIQNRPGYTVETHMLKDYKTRVTGNYEVLRGILQVVNRDADKLVKNNRDADAASANLGKDACQEPHAVPAAEGAGATTACSFPLHLEPTGKTEPFLFKGFKYTKQHSELSNDTWVQYSKEPMEITIPRQNELKATKTVTVPRAYIVPAQWAPVIEILQAHGLKLLTTTNAYEGEVEMYRCEAPTWSAQSFEGHHLAGWKTPQPCKLAREKMGFAAGSIVVPLDQRAAKVAIHLLEPEAPDSFVAWGFFDTVFEQKEYGEGYVLEKLAREMIAKDPKLKAEFDAKVASDKEFAGSPAKRLNWFYQRSPWWDDEYGRYPVGRLTSLEGVPVE